MKERTPRGDRTRGVLERLVCGEIDVDEAHQDLRLLQVDHLEGLARLDVNRDRRKGVPEVVFAPGKSEEAVEAIARRLLEERGLALISRLDAGRAEKLKRALTEGPTALGDVEFDHRADAGALACHTPSYEPADARGCVGILTAGTSDIPVAEEAAMVAEYMGCRIERGYDVGVAGLHRLVEPLRRVLLSGAEVIISGRGHGGGFALGRGRAGGRACHRAAHLDRLRTRRRGQGGPLLDTAELLARVGRGQHRQRGRCRRRRGADSTRLLKTRIWWHTALSDRIRPFLPVSEA